MSPERVDRSYRLEPLDSSGIFLGLGLVQCILLGGGIELAVNLCTREITQKFRSVGVPVQTTFRPSGTHSWAYWETDLHNTWPKLAADLN